MTQSRFSKHFQRREAQDWIPRLQRIFAQIHEALESVRGEVEAITRQERRVGGNGGGVDATLYFSGDGRIHELLHEMQDAGIVIQDIHRGLIDFPCLLDDVEVFLCWEIADGDSLGFYHHLTAGFAGRKPLPPLED